MTDRTTTVARLRRGDVIATIDGHPIGETVAAVDIDTDTGIVAVTTRRGPQRRRAVRHLLAGVPVTTDLPLPAWRILDTPRPFDRQKLAANAAAFGAGVALGLMNREPAAGSEEPIIDQIRNANAGTGT